MPTPISFQVGCVSARSSRWQSSCDRKLLFLDEPTTALDVVVQRSILQSLDDLRHELGFGIVFITHDLSLLVEIADRIAIMYAGRHRRGSPVAANSTKGQNTRIRRP